MKGEKLLVLAILGLPLLLGACLGPDEMVVLNVQFIGMDPNVGQRFEARLLDQGGSEIERSTIASISSTSFSMEFVGVVIGKSYSLEFYADVNGNGVYDAPPADHAWELEITVTASSDSVTFARIDSFTDIGWGGGMPTSPAIDGVIEDGEYAHSFTDPGINMQVYWRNDQTTLTMGMVSPGTGWISVGFDATNVMEDSNFIMAAVNGSQLVIEDHYGTGPFSHSRDAEQNILDSAGRESGGQTIVEFSIPLDSGDSWDKPLTPGNTYPLLLGYHSSSDDMTRKHSAASTIQFTLDP